MRQTITALTVAALIALTGCSSDEQSDDNGASGGERGGGEASVQQFASKVAGVKHDIDDWITDWEEATCSSIAVDQGAADCHAYAVAGGYTAESAYLGLNGLTSEQSTNYLGEPPEEIAALYEETVETAKAASDAGEAFGEVDCDSDDGCLGEVHRLASTMKDLQTKLTEWSPYL